MVSCRSHWPRGPRRSSAAARLLRLCVRIPLGYGCLSVVSGNCWVLSGRGPCDELITRPENSYLLWCAVLCGLKTSWMRSLWPTGDCRIKNKQKKWPLTCETIFLSCYVIVRKYYNYKDKFSPSTKCFYLCRSYSGDYSVLMFRLVATVNTWYLLAA
jgi:hypothetical protein